MPKPQTRYALYLTIALLGVHAQIAQALLAREGLVAFYGNELSLGAFYGGWLWWLALGSLLAVRWRDRSWVKRPLPLLRALVLALPLLLLGQMLLLRGVRLLLDVSPSEFIPLGQMFLALLLATLPSGLALGLAILAAVLNFLLFFGRDIWTAMRAGRRRMERQARRIQQENEPVHRCVVCGVTDKSNPEMDFRYCSRCVDSPCYCAEHIRDHAGELLAP